MTRALLFAFALVLAAGCSEPGSDAADSGACDPEWHQLVDERLVVLERDLALLEAPRDGGCSCAAR
jgi:hypothetical protein